MHNIQSCVIILQSRIMWKVIKYEIEYVLDHNFFRIKLRGY